MNMKTDKKIYKINDNVEIEKIEEIAKGIVKKALKVIETSGNRWATRIIEGQDRDTMEDLKQLVILEIIENNYKITKECYRKVNKYLYNYKVNRIKNIEIVVNDDENISNVDRYSYINYIKEERNDIENREMAKKFSLEMLNLTEKQKEILNVYSKLGSFGKTAEILGVAKSTVQVTIERIRKKAVVVCGAIEY